MEGKYKIKETDEYLEILPTDVTPSVILTKKDKNLLIKGVLIAEDSLPLFSQLMQIVKDNGFPKTLELQLVYINTQALKELIRFLYFLEQNNANTKVTWFYSDEELADLGSQLESLIQLPFEKIYTDLEHKDYFSNDYS